MEEKPIIACLRCKHQRPFSGGCEAYPIDIPMKFTSGIELHDKVQPDQIGDFVFEEGETEEDRELGLI